MLLRRLLLPIGALVLVASAPGLAAAAWSGSGSGAAAAKAATLTAPTGVNITACSTTGKSSGIVSGSVSMSWTVSAGPNVTGQQTYVGIGSPTPTYTQNGTAIANNTTATRVLSFSLGAGTYRVGVTGTRTNWVSSVAGSSDSFTVTTAGSNGSCSNT